MFLLEKKNMIDHYQVLELIVMNYPSNIFNKTNNHHDQKYLLYDYHEKTDLNGLVFHINVKVPPQELLRQV